MDGGDKHTKQMDEINRIIQDEEHGAGMIGLLFIDSEFEDDVPEENDENEDSSFDEQFFIQMKQTVDDIREVFLDKNVFRHKEDGWETLQERQDHIISRQTALFVIDQNLKEGEEEDVHIEFDSHLGNEILSSANNYTHDVLLTIDDVQSFEDLEKVYHVSTLPYLILIKDGKIILKEIPTFETRSKIIKLLGIDDTIAEQDNGP